MEEHSQVGMQGGKEQALGLFSLKSQIQIPISNRILQSLEKQLLLSITGELVLIKPDVFVLHPSSFAANTSLDHPI